MSSSGKTSTAIVPLHDLVRRHVLTALDRCGGNRRATARLLGISDPGLRHKLRKYGVKNVQKVQG